MTEQDTDDVAPLTLAPSPASVPRARAFVRHSLARSHADVVDRAEQCVSELVTNAVVHAGTACDVRIAVVGGRIRLEVHDASPVAPLQLVRRSRAATGRGLALVAALSVDWGIALDTQRGKAVWCELSPEPSAAGDEDDLLAAWSDDDIVVVPLSGTVPRPVTGDVPRQALLIGHPVRRGMREREHDRELLRECVLIDQSSPQYAAAQACLRARAALAQVHDLLWAEPEERKLKAYREVVGSIDLTYELLPGTAELLTALYAAYDALDRVEAQEAMLTLQTPPDVAELRAWTLAELISQAKGGGPTPWPGPVD